MGRLYIYQNENHKKPTIHVGKYTTYGYIDGMSDAHLAVDLQHPEIGTARLRTAWKQRRKEAVPSPSGKQIRSYIWVNYGEL